MKRTLFLDRDGVVNVDHGYIYRPDEFEFIDGVFDACHAFQEAGYEIVIITNQSGIGRGYYTEQDFHALTNWMISQFNQRGIDILDVYFCPHHPKNANPPYLQRCACRKPQPGMLLQAIQEHKLDARHSIMIGDKSSDMTAARNAGIGQKYLVTSGQRLSDSDKALADRVFDNLPQMAAAVLHNKV